MKINPIFKLFLLITLFTITSVESRLYVYNETTSTQTVPRIWSAINYPSDSTLVFKIVHRVPSNDTTQVYLQEKLSLRILFQNGTVNSLDLDLQIPSINYILRSNWISLGIDPLKIYPIKHGYILVTYINTTNSSDIRTYEEWGMIIDWNGNIISKQKFGDSYIFNNIWYPQSDVRSNVNLDKGWIFVNYIRDSYNLNLKQFTMNGTGISLLSEAIIGIESLSSGTAQVKVIPTMDEGYAIILANTTRSNNLTNTTVSNNITTTTNPLAVGGQMFIYNLQYRASSVNAPKLLYQTPLDNLLFLSLQCDVDFANVGQSCVLTLRQNTTTSPDISAPTYYIKVSFLSSGSVINISSINSILPAVSPNVTRWNIHSLSYGGYLLTTNLAIDNTTVVDYGYLYDDIHDNTTQWDLGEPAPASIKGVLQILANNTLVVAQKEDLGGWSLLVSELPKFAAAIDKGYSNLHIQGTVPQIGQQITPPMNQITINYYKAVELSGGSISVYLTQDGAKDILRQTVVGTDTRYCSISSDGLTINVKMISSAFSQQNGKYYIKVGNNFVQSKEFQEPLMGIQENIWKFTTAPQDEMVAGTASGILRLTPDGTDYFETLDSAGQTQFFNTLIQEFADILPIQSSRLSTNGRTQIDVSVLPLRQLILSIDIEKTKDPTSKSVANIIKDLNAMITNKDVSPINNGNSTKYLDSGYGLQPKQNIWEKYKLRFLGVFLGVALLITLFLLAQRRESKGRNIAVLQLGLIIFDLVVDVLFIVNNGRDVESLYIPSVIFLTVPIALNAMLAFAIISKENTRLDFYTWFSEHGKVASIFTVLAGIDIDALTILHSNLAGFAAFRAPFSNSAITKIFWGACAKIFLEDLPQVIIQILYQQKTVTYDIIPLLTLISSCLNLTINIIGRTYQATNIVRHKGRRDTSSFDEDFGNISDDQTGALNKEPLTREHDKSDERIESNSDIDDSQRAGFNLKDRFKEIKFFKKY